MLTSGLVDSSSSSMARKSGSEASSALRAIRRNNLDFFHVIILFFDFFFFRFFNILEPLILDLAKHDLHNMLGIIFFLVIGPSTSDGRHCIFRTGGFDQERERERR